MFFPRYILENADEFLEIDFPFRRSRRLPKHGEPAGIKFFNPLVEVQFVRVRPEHVMVAAEDDHVVEVMPDRDVLSTFAKDVSALHWATTGWRVNTFAQALTALAVQIDGGHPRVGLFDEFLMCGLALHRITAGNSAFRN